MFQVVNRWLDNPIFVKHARSRLRKGQVVPSVAIVLTLCLLIGWGGYMLNGYDNGMAFGVLLGLQSILLAIIGASQVSTSVGSARESGIIDFHRVSPMSPLALTLGFFFGAPVREYVLFGCTLPLSLFCAAMGVPSALNLVQILMAAVLVAWLLHAIALLNSLIFKWRKGMARGGVGVIVFALMGAQYFVSSASSAAVLSETGPVVGFYGVMLPWFLFTVISLLPTLFFLLIPCVRKMHSERAHAYTKPQALACLAYLAVMLAGAVPADPGGEFRELFVLYALVLAAVVLACTITPTRAEYIRSLRRAGKQGRKHLSPWDDLALNRMAVAGLCLVVLVAASVCWRYTPASPISQAGGGFAAGLNSYGFVGEYSFSISIAVGVLTVAYFGLAFQFFSLYLSQRSLAAAVMGLFLFLAWLVPLVVGGILSAAGWPDEASTIAWSLSPIYGITSSVGVGAQAHGQAAQLAALLPALGFVYLFNNLLGRVRRRIDNAVRAAMDKLKDEPQAQAGALAEV